MDTAPKRRWFRYSLRTLLVFVTIAGTGFGWLGMKVRAKLTEREAVKAIEELGGWVYYDYEFDSDEIDYEFDAADKLIDSPAPHGPEWLRKLLGDDFLATVGSVSFDGVQITDVGPVSLVGLTQLERLSLNYTQIDDAGLSRLEELKQLKTLRLRSTPITDAGLFHLRRLKQLERLNLDFTQISGAGLVHLEELKQLKWLRLRGTQITDAGLSAPAE